MISVTVTGTETVQDLFRRIAPSVHAALVARVAALSLVLQAYIQRDKLSGQVLNVKTGALRRSIFSEVDETESSIFGRVYSSGDVKYARIHELGGRTKAHVIFAKNGKALRFAVAGVMGVPGGYGPSLVFAQHVNHPGSVMPERSFMRSGLADKAPVIQTQLKEALIQGLLSAGGRLA